jgi:glycosyltransferase involved in cell wall biosynthesis
MDAPARLKVSVVVPTYNRSHSVGTAVRSVLQQELEALECIVVDDGSTDDTAATVASIHDDRVRYVRRAHAGVAAARNAGVADARAGLIAFLDSDDVWRPDKLRREVALLEEHREVDAVFSDLEKHDGGRIYPSFMRDTGVFSARLLGRSFPDGVVLPRREMFLVLLQEVPIKPSALTLRRAAFTSAGGFDEKWSSSEDWEFLIRFAARYAFAYIDRAMTVLRVGSDSLHRVDQARGEQAMIALLQRHQRTLRHDRDACVAIRRGLITRTKHFGWHYTTRGRRRDAAAVFLRGFMATGSLGLLARAAAVLVPGAMAA